MMMRVLATLIALSIGGCLFVTDTCACTLVPPGGTVEGRVTTATGSPVSGALITLIAVPNACPSTTSTRLTLLPDTTRTSSGDYLIYPIVQSTSPEAACLTVTVQVPARALHSSAPVTLPLNGGRVRVDVQLPD